MKAKEHFKNKSARYKNVTKKTIYKITSVCVVVLMILMAYHTIRFDTEASEPWKASANPSKANAGYENFYHYTDGMVNSANGNLVFSQKDISIKARGFNIEVIRTFNTQERTSAYPNDNFGLGWTCNYFIFLQEDFRSGNVTLTEGDGSVYVYGFWQTIGGGGVGASYYTPAGKHARLNKSDDGTFTLRYLDGSIYNFDGNGILQNITDKNENKLKFTYSFGKLTKVEEDFGMEVGDTVYVNFNYQGNIVDSITDSSSRTISYTYDSNTLVNVTDSMGNITQYSYNSPPGPPSTLLDRIIYKNGAGLEFDYVFNATYGTYMVHEIFSLVWISSFIGATDILSKYQFSYYAITASADWLNHTYLRTVITNANGYDTTVYMNEYGNPLKITDPTGNYTMTKWDTDFNKISFSDASNNTYTFTYDGYTENEVEKTYGFVNTTTDPALNSMINEYEYKNTGDEYVALLTSRINKRGYKTAYEYNSTNYNLEKITDAKRNNSEYSYDDNGNVISYTDFRGFTTTYTYDVHGNLLNVTDPGGNVTTYGYDMLNRLINTTIPRGFISTYEYDDLDRIVKITDPTGNSTTYIYDEGSEGVYTTGIYGGCGGGYSIGSHTPIAIIDANGLQTNLTLNHTIKRIEKIEEAPGCGCSEKNFKYDQNGNLIEFADANENKITYEYDSLNRLRKEIDARNNYTTYTYDENGNLLTITNRRGYMTTYEYNILGSSTIVTDATGNSTEYIYDAEGNLKTMTNARGYTTTYYYDELNRLIKIKDALYYNTTFTYDGNGNIKTETDPNVNTITHSYDALNRLISVKDAMNHGITYDYDSMGNKLNETDANGNKKQYAYNALNQLVSITDANNNITYFTYDATDKLLNITDANGYKTRNEFDDLGHHKRIIFPSGNQTQYDYDSVGNMIERIDAKNLSTYYEYNDLNRLVKITYPDNSTIVYEYDHEGNIIKVTNNVGFGETSEYIYDEMDRVISTKVDYGSFDKYVNYTYDEVGNRKTMIDPEGNVTYYTYGALNRLINISALGQNPILFQYDNAGRRTQLDYPNGAYTTYSYDNANRITTIWHKTLGGTTIAVYNYTYDNTDNILNFTENDVNFTTYTYDNVYRLTNVSYPDGSWTAYAYDGVGNRLTMKTNSNTTSYTYDEDNRILTAGNIIYNHDENGNLINRTDGGNITLYEYDYDYRLTKVTLANSSNVVFQYSSNGQRLNQTSPIETTLFFYDGYNILMELDKNGEKKAFYEYGPNIDEPIFMIRNGVSYNYHTDYLGSINVLTDANENVVATYQYDAFGSFIQESGSVINPYRYNGREWDPDPGLYYTWARYYDTIVGRFLQKSIADVIHGSGVYTYALGNDFFGSPIYLEGLKYALLECSTTVDSSNVWHGEKIGYVHWNVDGNSISQSLDLEVGKVIYLMLTNPGLNSRTTEFRISTHTITPRSANIILHTSAYIRNILGENLKGISGNNYLDPTTVGTDTWSFLHWLCTFRPPSSANPGDYGLYSTYAYASATSDSNLIKSDSALGDFMIMYTVNSMAITP